MLALSRIAGGLVDALFPPGCAACDEPTLQADGPLCVSCSTKLASVVAPDYCGCCGRDVGPHLLRDHRCSDCQSRRPPFERFLRIGRYRGVLRDLVLKFKYGGAPTLDAVLGGMLADLIGGAPGFADIHAWVPIPSARMRTWRRHYQPTGLLADFLSGRTHQPRLDLLQFARSIREQKRLPGDQRPANVRDAFRIAHGTRLNGAVLGLVDDVFTSGSTMREAARA